MKWLFLALILVPTLELALLIWAGGKIGFFVTLAIILGTGLLGAYLAKKQGLKAIRDIQESFSRLQPPGDHLMNAAFVLVGGVLLLTPGFISDAIGLTLLFKPTQLLYKPLVYKLIQKNMKNTRVIVR
ncbi:FxsA family protein [Planococcus shenhongbingii]|uniref:FxsA family protein n=1 Tax=Planococcus shenhongbingii TaxID=3058398 RepID=A0ABT8NDK4_9BACL|nr:MULTISPECIES: FxsA family protein [unclassified Planococcus (in: firmicutes)]MDN7245970.1 FxsA family protein [Planococcus sp. N017]WKA59898.1 FxsA family protein [Planococcus sp. N016]